MPVVGISLDRYDRYAIAALHKAGVTYPNWTDYGSAYTATYSVVPKSVVPSSALIMSGRVIAVHVGPFDSISDITTYLSEVGVR